LLSTASLTLKVVVVAVVFVIVAVAAAQLVIVVLVTGACIANKLISFIISFRYAFRVLIRSYCSLVQAPCHERALNTLDTLFGTLSSLSLLLYLSLYTALTRP